MIDPTSDRQPTSDALPPTPPPTPPAIVGNHSASNGAYAIITGILALFGAFHIIWSYSPVWIYGIDSMEYPYYVSDHFPLLIIYLSDISSIVTLLVGAILLLRRHHTGRMMVILGVSLYILSTSILLLPDITYDITYYITYYITYDIVMLIFPFITLILALSKPTKTWAASGYAP
ncbi:hypothetical protein ACL02S_09470 [Nocardia sp. 004]|uniref:hypothetical protein n=1 Tax=Nocardia sp. 004 TaxID=3385978 RepID=UPI0039A1CB1F